MKAGEGKLRSPPVSQDFPAYLSYNFPMNPKEKVPTVPASPGVYVMKGAKERILYVGKAKNLRNRLRSYFQKSASLDDRKAKMVEEIRDFDYIITKNELEALILEANYIKRTKPPYNIILRDDKNYPYLKLTIEEEWPRLAVVRRIAKDGALYFGPYVPAGAMWEMLDFIRRNFPIRICKYRMNKPFRPCVQYQMGRCLAPCAEDKRTEEHRKAYQGTVEEVRAFIRGEKKELLHNLQKRMEKLSGELLFEEAAKIRDRLTALNKAWESQRIIAPGLGDLDVMGLYRNKQEASIFLFFIRNGSVLGQKDFFLKKLGEMDDRELISNVVEQFYSKEMLLPPKIILPVNAQLSTERKWLTEKRGKDLQLRYARGDLEKKALKMANENAFYAFNRHKETRIDETAVKIKELLQLSAVPARIGVVDISNISGSESVGSLILYENGKFEKDDYRLFRIKTVQGTDDFAMIGEVVSRYLKNAANDDHKLPQLLLIDGGRGQLGHAVEALKPFGLPIEVAAIAKAKHDRSKTKHAFIHKEMDRIYLPGKRMPVYLEPALATTHMLQKIRDEAHRFAITYHRKLRSKKTLTSPLENVPGIGKTRRLILLKHFGSLDAIRRASIDDLASVKGMNRKVAEDLKKHLMETLRHKEAKAQRND